MHSADPPSSLYPMRRGSSPLPQGCASEAALPLCLADAMASLPLDASLSSSSASSTAFFSPSFASTASIASLRSASSVRRSFEPTTPAERSQQSQSQPPLFVEADDGRFGGRPPHLPRQLSCASAATDASYDSAVSDLSFSSSSSSSEPSASTLHGLSLSFSALSPSSASSSFYSSCSAPPHGAHPPHPIQAQCAQQLHAQQQQRQQEQQSHSSLLSLSPLLMMTPSPSCPAALLPLPPPPFAPASPVASSLSLTSVLSPVDPHLVSCMFRSEHAYQPSPFYLECHAELDACMRPVLFDWLMEVAAEFRLQRETAQLAVNYVERFLSVRATATASATAGAASEAGQLPVIDKANYQLLGITCLFLACKVEESRPPRAEELARTTDGACVASAICEMERCVLRALSWRLHCVTSCAWLKLLLKLTVRRLHAQLVDTLSAHFAQSPHCGERLARVADVDDPLRTLRSSPCPLCSALYGQFTVDLAAFLSLASFHTAAQLCDLAAFDLLSLHYYPSSVATAALLIAHSGSPSRLRLLCDVSGYSVQVLSGLLHALQKWHHFPVHARVGGDEEEQTGTQVHYRGALDRWRHSQRAQAAGGVLALPWSEKR